MALEVTSNTLQQHLIPNISNTQHTMCTISIEYAYIVVQNTPITYNAHAYFITPNMPNTYNAPNTNTQYLITLILVLE